MTGKARPAITTGCSIGSVVVLRSFHAGLVWVAIASFVAGGVIALFVVAGPTPRVVLVPSTPQHVQLLPYTNGRPFPAPNGPAPSHAPRR